MLREEALKLLNQPTMKLMLEILTDERPSRKDREKEVNPHYLHVQLGRLYGYEEFLVNLEDLTKPPDKEAVTDDELAALPQAED